MTERQIGLVTDKMILRHNDRKTYSFNDIFLKTKWGEHKAIVTYYMWKGNKIRQRRMICH